MLRPNAIILNRVRMLAQALLASMRLKPAI